MDASQSRSSCLRFRSASTTRVVDKEEKRSMPMVEESLAKDIQSSKEDKYSHTTNLPKHRIISSILKLYMVQECTMKSVAHPDAVPGVIDYDLTQGRRNQIFQHFQSIDQWSEVCSPINYFYALFSSVCNFDYFIRVFGIETKKKEIGKSMWSRFGISIHPLARASPDVSSLEMIIRSRRITAPAPTSESTSPSTPSSAAMSDSEKVKNVVRQILDAAFLKLSIKIFLQPLSVYLR